jgi:uncharacterized protein YjiS (DUF1127 family)
MFKKILHKIQDMQQRRADYFILMNMSDRELRDLGIGRSEIRQRLYGEESY